MKLLLSFLGLIAIVAMLVIPPSASVLASTETDFQVFVTGTGDATIHELELRATEGDNGQIMPVSGFTIKPESIIQLDVGQNLMVFTSTNEAERVIDVKVTNQAGQMVALQDVGSDWSLQGFAAGVYLLDVIADIPDGSRGAYETVLVIGQDASSNTQVISQVQKTAIQIVFKDADKIKPSVNLRKICTFNPSDPRCKPGPDGKCPPGWATNEDGNCFPPGQCPSGYHRANDDETGRCVPDRDLKQCEDGSWAYKDDQCPEDFPPLTPCPDGTSVPEGESCPLTEELEPTGCQPEDDFCDTGCESPTMDCIDDVNIGDDGEDSVPEEEEEEEAEDEEPVEEEESSDGEQDASEDEEAEAEEG